MGMEQFNRDPLVQRVLDTQQRVTERSYQVAARFGTSAVARSIMEALRTPRSDRTPLIIVDFKDGRPVRAFSTVKGQVVAFRNLTDLANGGTFSPWDIEVPNLMTWSEAVEELERLKSETDLAESDREL